MKDNNKNKTNVPNLRFPGFEEEWERKEIGQTMKIGSGRDYKHLKEGEIPVFGTGGYMTSVNDHLMDGETVCIGRKGTINKPFYYSGKFWTVDTLFYTHSFKGIIPKFAFHVFEHINWLKYNEASGVPSLSKNTIEQIEIEIPSIPEQNKVGLFLSLVDERIQCQSKIIEELKSFKSAVSKRIFSQELRFKDENGEECPDWEEKKLWEIAEKRIKKNIDNKIINVFTNSAINGIVNQRDFFEKDIANQNNLNGYYIVENNDFVYNPRISSTAPVGPISRNHLGSGVMSPLYSVFRLKLGNIDFIECIFNTNVWHKHMENIANYGARADRMSFAIGDFYEMPIPFPSLSEQTKIANFLSSIDEKIETEKQIIEQYKKQKAYLLQNIFI